MASNGYELTEMWLDEPDEITSQQFDNLEIQNSPLYIYNGTDTIPIRNFNGLSRPEPAPKAFFFEGSRLSWYNDGHFSPENFITFSSEIIGIFVGTIEIIIRTIEQHSWKIDLTNPDSSQWRCERMAT